MPSICILQMQMLIQHLLETVLHNQVSLSCAIQRILQYFQLYCTLEGPYRGKAPFICLASDPRNIPCNLVCALRSTA
jgi:hypothetical protein